MNNLFNILSRNEPLFKAINILKNITSEQFYIGAGAIAQTVWNYHFGNDLAFGIDDFDIAYYNSSDLSEGAENKVIEYLAVKLKQIPIKLDIKNQARVHLWYKYKFGYEISPISSIEDAIDRWPTTSTSIAVRINDHNLLDIYSPFGLDDLFSYTIRANKRQITPEIYENKIKKWILKWPKLKVIPWS
jgi:hypothetical protein